MIFDAHYIKFSGGNMGNVFKRGILFGSMITSLALPLAVHATGTTLADNPDSVN